MDEAKNPARKGTGEGVLDVCRHFAGQDLLIAVNGGVIVIQVPLEAVTAR